MMMMIWRLISFETGGLKLGLCPSLGFHEYNGPCGESSSTSLSNRPLVACTVSLCRPLEVAVDFVAGLSACFPRSVSSGFVAVCPDSTIKLSCSASAKGLRWCGPLAPGRIGWSPVQSRMMCATVPSWTPHALTRMVVISPNRGLFKARCHTRA